MLNNTKGLSSPTACDASNDASDIGAITVQQFCAKFNISRAHFYNLLNAGKGPRIMKAGRRTLISKGAVTDWCRCLESQGATTV